MNILLALAAALSLGATIAGYPGHPAAEVPCGSRVTARSDGAAPDAIRSAVRRAVGFDRLAPLLAGAR
jgi:hypothetical protein